VSFQRTKLEAVGFGPQQTGRDVGRHPGALDEQRARAAERVDQRGHVVREVALPLRRERRDHLRPAGAHEDRRGQVLLERRLELRSRLCGTRLGADSPREVDAERRRRALW
jgi:hypothetical protein